MKMHQVDVRIYSEWDSLVTSKPKGCITYVNQWFVTKASRLSKKWQDKIGSFQEVKKRALELVSELGPSFEEAEKEKSQGEDEIKVDKEDKGKQ
jgi:hypothetical protein